MTAKSRLLIPLAIGLAILLFFHRLAFSGLILARGDTFLYFYPYWKAAAGALFSAGRVPLWNDSLFMGAPFLANSQTGLFYPLNWPVWALFSTPYAVSASVLVHLFIAGCGAYLAARRCYQVDASAALLAALLFALGGYLTAQVEHVNQLQALAWLPWYFAAWGDGSAVLGSWRRRLRLVASLSLLIALQFTAGHMQSLFITSVGFIVWLTSKLVSEWQASRGPSAGQYAGRAFLFILAPAGALALVLVAGQLLPTLELTQLSSRQGGLPLNEALSFSLHPLLLTRALLPAYGQTMFTEYVAFVPLMGLLLALVGAWSWRSQRMILPLLIVALLGLFFAFGRFNPIYVLLARLPGFSFFRVPARWLALYGFGIALLAGIGLQRVREKGISRRQLIVGLLLTFGLMLWSVLSAPLAGRLPLGDEVSFELPSLLTWSGWLIELALVVLLLRFWPARWQRQRPGGILLVIVVVLFLASRLLPYNNLTTPAAFFELRPPVSRLLVQQDCRLHPENCEQPPGRLLSLSEIFFDLGDQGEIESAYADLLPSAALFDYLVASKQKAVLAPNLPLTYGLASVDGFDGGILPLRDYSLVTSLLLPDGVISTDGRLRELMTEVPEDRWLDMFNARYLITDKVGDESAWTWRLMPVADPASELAAGHADLAMVAGEAGLPLGVRPVVAAVPFTTDWESIDLASAQHIAANGHSLVQIVFWDELRPPLRALRVNGFHPTDPAYPLLQPYVLQTGPGQEEAADFLAPYLAGALMDHNLVQVAAVGDINMDRALGAIVAGGRTDFPFSQVAPHLQSADIAVGNFECSLGNVGEPEDKSYAFRAPPEAAQSLADAGFDVITLANNHALDYGPEALMQGIDLLEEQAMSTIGAGITADAARAPAFLERNGLTIAFLGYVQVPVEGHPPYFDTQTWTATADKPGLAWAVPEEVAADVAAARIQSDVVIVVLHSGVEYVSAPSPEQMAAARAAIDAGAALVIGHHAHILQGVEFYNGGVIVYGLANFAFNIIGPPETAILQAWLDAGGDAP